MVYNRVIGQTGVVTVYTPLTKWYSVVSDKGANFLSAQAGIWAGWNSTDGLFTSTGLLLPKAGRGYVGPDGSMAYCPDYQTGLGMDVLSREGDVWRLTNGPASDVTLLGGRKAIWCEGTTLCVTGFSAVVCFPKAWKPKAIQVGTKWWLCYWAADSAGKDIGLVLHPADSMRGYLLSTTNAFAPDIRLIPGGVQVVWAINEGEQPGEMVTRDLAIETAARIDLTTLLNGTPVEPPKPVDPPIIPPKTETPVKYPARVQEIINTIHSRNQDLANGSDDQRRELTQKIVQQIVFELGDTWGWKSNHGIGIAGSKDGIAQRRGPLTENQRQMLWMWDWQNGGTRQPNQFPDSIPEDESMQFFWPLPGKDILGAVPPGPDPKPQPALLDKIAQKQNWDFERGKRIEAKLDQLIARLGK